ncbi:MAG: glycosyltransferase family 39 protein [Planctomycetes bacterium]|nr:glycosyltransferase family 39 protein [Planctomycetota bacterium]
MCPMFSRLSLPLLVLVCGALFFYRLGDRDLHSSHEARAAQNAQMILEEGNWGLPRLFDRHIELQKPPLYYWLIALIAQILGGQVDVWAVRLPAALSALGCVWFLYFLGWKRGRPVAGLLAALFLATSLHFTWLARVGRTDMPLTLSVALAVGCFFLGQRNAEKSRASWGWFLAGYLAIAVGIMFKGPIAAIFALGIVGVNGVAESFRAREKKAAVASWRRSLLWGIPLVALVTGPWFVWANMATDGRLWEVFFWYHNVERGLGGAETLAAHPVWFYFPRAFIDLLPWSLLILPAAYLAWREGWGNLEPEGRLGAVWFGFIFVFLSLMRFKRADYLLPAFPGAALFLASMASRLYHATNPLFAPGVAGAAPGVAGAEALRSPGVSRVVRRGALIAGFMTCLVLTIGGWLIYFTFIAPVQEHGWPYRQLAHDIRRQTDMPVIFFRAESHLLAFHVGRPLDTILEWENLEVWATRPEPIFVVMPADCAACRHAYLDRGRLEEMFRTSDHPWGKHERPLVVLRSCPPRELDKQSSGPTISCR